MYGDSNTKLSKLNKLYMIHTEIASGSAPKAQDLAKKLGCGITSIYNYITELQHEPYNAPIYVEGNFGGYKYSGDSYRFPYEDKLLGNNLNMLSSAKFLLDYFENSPLYEEIENTLNSICKLQKDTPLLNRIALAPTTNTTEKLKYAHYWKLLCSALSENHILRFKYLNNTWDPDLEKATLHVRPYQLLIDGGKNLLFGYLEEKDALRLFNINDMYELVETNKEFKLPEDYEFKNHTGNSNFGAFTRYAPRTYKIAFYEDAIEEVKKGNWAKDQSFEDDIDEDGYPRTIITFTSAQDMRILDWVCKNKCYAKPLEPESLVLRWKYNVAIMAKTAGFNVEVDDNLRIRAEELEKAGK